MMTSKGKVFIVGIDKHVFNIFYDEGYTIVGRQSDADIIVFIGGSDINPNLYGEGLKHRKTFCSPHEDKRDMDAWRASTTNQFKAGICRGGQLLNVLNNGKLYQHVTNHAGKHKIFDTVSNTEIEVSSSHHQMMIPGKDAEILGYSEGVGDEFYGPDAHVAPRPKIEWESLYYGKTNSLCYQPHPEWHGADACRKNFFDLITLLR